MLLGFKRQFAPFVEDGSKTHTIRARRGDGKLPSVGETLHCYVDPRQKSMRLLGRFRCTGVEPIVLDFGKHGIAYTLRIRINGQPLDFAESVMFAWRDGFRCGLPVSALRSGGTAPLDWMARMWIEQGRLIDALDSPPWTGNLIHWAFPADASAGSHEASPAGKA